MLQVVSGAVDDAELVLTPTLAAFGVHVCRSSGVIVVHCAREASFAVRRTKDDAGLVLRLAYANLPHTTSVADFMAELRRVTAETGVVIPPEFAAKRSTVRFPLIPAVRHGPWLQQVLYTLLDTPHRVGVPGMPSKPYVPPSMQRVVNKPLLELFEEIDPSDEHNDEALVARRSSVRMVTLEEKVREYGIKREAPQPVTPVKRRRGRPPKKRPETVKVEETTRTVPRAAPRVALPVAVASFSYPLGGSQVSLGLLCDTYRRLLLDLEFIMAMAFPEPLPPLPPLYGETDALGDTRFGSASRHDDVVNAADPHVLLDMSRSAIITEGRAVLWWGFLTDIHGLLTPRLMLLAAFGGMPLSELDGLELHWSSHAPVGDTVVVGRLHSAAPCAVYPVAAAGVVTEYLHRLRPALVHAAVRAQSFEWFKGGSSRMFYMEGGATRAVRGLLQRWYGWSEAQVGGMEGYVGAARAWVGGKGGHSAGSEKGREAYVWRSGGRWDRRVKEAGVAEWWWQRLAAGKAGEKL